MKLILYLCLIKASDAVVPQTWSNWALVIVGLFGTIAALCTLRSINRQTKSMRLQARIMSRQTTEARRSADAAHDAVTLTKLQAETAAVDMRRLNRAYLTVDTWRAQHSPENAEIPSPVGIQFSIYNPSRTAARVERINYKVGTEAFAETAAFMLTPQERHVIRIPTRSAASPFGRVFTISGRITYRDIFGKERHRTFSQGLQVSDKGEFHFYQVDALGMNDEEEWNRDD